MLSAPPTLEKEESVCLAHLLCSTRRDRCAWRTSYTREGGVGVLRAIPIFEMAERCIWRTSYTREGGIGVLRALPFLEKAA